MRPLVAENYIPQRRDASRPGAREKKNDQTGTVPSTKVEVGLLAGVVKNEADFANDSGTVPRPAASVGEASRFMSVSWEKYKAVWPALAVLQRKLAERGAR